MKSSNDDHRPGSDRGVGESMAADENAKSDTVALLPGERAEENYTEFKGTIDEGEALKNLMQMSRGLAHQLNNHLTTILANTQLVFLMLENEELRPYLKAVEHATRDAADMVATFQESIRALAQMSPQDS